MRQAPGPGCGACPKAWTPGAIGPGRGPGARGRLVFKRRAGSLGPSGTMNAPATLSPGIRLSRKRPLTLFNRLFWTRGEIPRETVLKHFGFNFWNPGILEKGRSRDSQHDTCNTPR